METIRGKMPFSLDVDGLAERLTDYSRVLLDVGTGDGRYVRFLADRNPDAFVIGVDACRENLHERSRAKLPNMLFIIARAQNLPGELSGLISHITINFPWGSLLESLLHYDLSLFDGLSSVSRQYAQIEIRLNGGALAEARTSLEAGAATIHENIERHGWKTASPCLLDTHALKSIPTTWAKRLAYGRDPRALQIKGMRSGWTR